ncbi:MAG: orotidine-5'-phosphate decarboxylase [Candidatus Omnitrophica bacterium]|nr:orotidine-5'-phosphate decarboxylase [Candidatus Omnitrophota bacterium]
MTEKNRGQLIVALDVDTFEEARQIVATLTDKVHIYKVGSQLFTACGPAIVRHLQALGKNVFLDLKFHDIPNTVAQAVKNVVRLNIPVFEKNEQDKRPGASFGAVILCTLHTSGGQEMLSLAAQIATKEAEAAQVMKPKLVGVTVLTSEANKANIRDIVFQRAQEAQASGLDGIVASGQEASFIRQKLGEDFIIITPGIRPPGSAVGDQTRVTTPSEAVQNGSDFLVVGRPVVKAENPSLAAESILQEIKQAKDSRP